MPSNQWSLEEATHQGCSQLDQERSISFSAFWYVTRLLLKNVLLVPVALGF